MNTYRTIQKNHSLKSRASGQRGSAMIEFAVVGPVLTLIGTIILQYALIFNAKNLNNHAVFMAARAGSMGNASLSTIENAYAKALIPLYGGGRDASELIQSLTKARLDIAGNAKIEMINPTKESFDDWADENLRAKYSARAIPNGGLAFKSPTEIKSNSGQNIQDANLIKLKITHGYEMKVPLAGSLIQFMMRWSDSGRDPFATRMFTQRRLPLVSNITMQMHSDPVEPSNPISIAGMGNGGNPTDPGMPQDPVKAPPRCVTAGCTVIIDPNAPVGGGGTPPLMVCQPGDPNCTALPTCPGA